jgi:hypothetical protein
VPPSQTPFPAKKDVNDVADNTDIRFQTYGVNRRPIPIILGKDRTGGMISLIRVKGNYLYLRVIWCIGEVQSCTVKNADGTAFSGTVTTYLGTTSQGIDPTLQGIIGGYSDTLVITKDGDTFGICYSVLKIRKGQDDHSGWPNFIAEIEGLKDIWDPRLSGGAGGYAYTKTAGLILNWLITNSVHGLGQSSDDTSLDALADYNEEELSDGMGYTEKRHEIGITILKRSDIVQYIEAVRGLARCMLVNRAGTYYYVSDKVRTSSGTLSSSLLVPQTVLPRPLDTRNAPNVVIVFYTNVSGDQWRDDMVEVAAPEVTAGTERRRELVLNVPQIQTKAAAKRHGTERLNKARLTTFITTFEMRDDGMSPEEGDVWDINEPELGGVQKIAILAKTLVGPGQYSFVADNYDANQYSDDVADNNEFTWSDDSDHPLFPPTVTGITITDFPVALPDDTWITYLDISWDDPSYTYLREYLVQIKQGTAIVHEYRTDNTSIRSGAVFDGISYTIEISIISTAFIKGAAATENHIPSPTLATPDWGINGAIDAIEVGGEIRLKVVTAPDDLDVRGYEWRHLSYLDNLFPDGYDVDSGQAANWSVVGGGGSVAANSDGNLVFTAGGSGLQTFKDTVIGELANLDYTGGIKLVAAINVVSISGGTGNEVIHLGDDSINTEANGKALSVNGVAFAIAELTDSYSAAPTDVRIWIESSQSSAQIEIQYAVFFMDLQDWDRATLIDRVPQLNTNTKELPEGFYRIYCKAFDSYVNDDNPNGQYSADIRALSVEVTSDVDSFFLGELDVGKPMTTEVNVFNFTLGRAGNIEYWIPHSGTVANSVFTSTPLDTNYPNIADSYGLASTALELITDDYNFETDVNATITRRADVLIFPEVGATDLLVQTQYSKAATPAVWVSESAEVANIVGQNFRIRYTTQNGDYVRIQKPAMKLLANAVPRNEQFEGTSLASGATTITLEKVYSFVRDISIEIVSSDGNPYTHKIDNIVMGDPSSFDLYCYRSDTGAQVAVNYRGHFEGI